MIRKVKIFIGIFCVICAGLSFLFYIHNNKSTINGLVASININVEIEKPYMENLVIVSEPDERIWQLMPTSSMDNNLKNEIVHAVVFYEYIQKISIRIPSEKANSVISSINNISVFVGNKLFYYNAFDIANWSHITKNDVIDYNIPVERYKKSIIKPWINWYGDLNFLLKEILELITHPHKFIFVYLFIFIAIFMFISEINTLIKRYNKQIEVGLVILLLIFGFILRIDGFTRHSLCWDELYSASFASNPNLPIANIFRDGANPPLYYLILRIWFIVFGWSETSGRLLSVVLGSMGIISLYYFVKFLCGKKYALISAFLLTISYTSIGFSNEMRSYTLLIILVPLISKSFFVFLQDQNFKSGLKYTICGILLVNTHLYGVLFIIGIFLFYFIYNRYNFERLVFCFTSNRYVSDRLKIIKFIITNCIIAVSFVPYFAITLLDSASIESNVSWYSLGKREYFYAILALLLYISGKIFTTRVNEYSFFNKREILLFEYTSFIIVFIYLSAIFISLQKPIFTWRYMTISLPLIIAFMPLFIFGFKKIISFIIPPGYSYRIITIICSSAILVFLSHFVNNWSKFGGGWWYLYTESQQYIVMDAKNNTSVAQVRASWWNDENTKFFGFSPLPVYQNSRMNQYDVVYLPIFEGMTDELLSEVVFKNGLKMDNMLRICVYDGRHPKESRYLYKIYQAQYVYNIINELQIPKDIEILTQNIYDIIAVKTINEDIILHCGTIDPQLNMSLPSALNKPSGEPLIEVTYTNSKAGYFKVYFNYGGGLNEKNSIGQFIEAAFEETTILLPFVEWSEEKQLVAFRIDPPNGTEFVIKSVKLFSADELQ
jgi:uncharacterized membrane protein